MEFLKIWEVLLRRKWIIIFVFFFFSGTVVLGLSMVTKTYEGTTKILARKSQALNHLKLSLGLPSEDEFDDDYEFKTELALATVRPLIKEFISKLDIKDRAGKPIEPDDLIDAGLMSKFRPQPALKVEQYEESQVLNVIAKSPDPEQAARMANTFSQMYIQAEVERVKNEYKAARCFIEEQIKKVKDDYFNTLAKLKEFRVKEKTLDLTSEIEKLIDRIDDLKTSYDNCELNIKSLSSEIVEIKTQLETLDEFKIDSREMTLNDQIKALQGTINDQLVSIAGIKVELKPNHPEYMELEAKLNQAREILTKQKIMVLSKEGHVVDPIYSALEKKLVDDVIAREIYIAKRDMWQRYIEKYQKKLMEIPIKQDTSSKIKSKSSVQKQQYEELMSYLIKVDIAESLTLGNFQLIESAKKPTAPDFPRRLIVLILAVFPATFWAFGLAFFIEYIDDTLKGARDLPHDPLLNVLGCVPYFPSLHIETISGLTWTAPAVECFRTVSNNLRYTFHDGQPRTLLVTSSTDEEGKTFMAVNLAITLSMEGKRVVLVDFNFKKPRIHDVFNLNSEKGVTQVISKKAGVDEAVYPTGTDGLSVMPSGVAVMEIPKWISPAQLQELTDSLKKKYDMVVFDTSALTPVNDAINIGTLMDAVILVVGTGQVTVSSVAQSKALLEKARVKLAGVIINKSRTYHFMSPVLTIRLIISGLAKRVQSFVKK